MTQGRWLAIIVGTLIVALAFWFMLLTVPSSTVVGLAIFGSGLAFAMYAVSGFSGADDIMGSGFAAALAALVVGGGVALFASSLDLGAVLALSPVMAIGIGGSRALAPTGDKARNSARLMATVIVAAAMYFVFTVDVTAYGLIAPLTALPALGIADRFYDRGREVIDEEVG